MLSYNWNLPLEQPGDNPPLRLLQEALLKAGFFLDLSFDGGTVRLTIAQNTCAEDDGTASPDGTGSPGCQNPDNGDTHGMASPDEAGSTDPTGTDGPEPRGPAPQGGTDAGRSPGKPKKRRGRPPATPVNDISIRRVGEMRSEGFSLEKIAKHIGVSRRVFFRSWAAAKEKNTDPDTPFSRWLE